MVMVSVRPLPWAALSFSFLAPGEGWSVCRLIQNQNKLPFRTADETVSDLFDASWHHCVRLRHLCPAERRGTLAPVHNTHGRGRYVRGCLARVERLRDWRFTGQIGRGALVGVGARFGRSLRPDRSPQGLLCAPTLVKTAPGAIKAMISLTFRLLTISPFAAQPCLRQPSAQTPWQNKKSPWATVSGAQGFFSDL